MDSDLDIYSDKDLLKHLLKKIALLESRLNKLERKIDPTVDKFNDG